MKQIAKRVSTKRALPTIRTRVALLVLACVVPAVVGFALLIDHFYDRERDQIKRDTLLTARALMLAVDRDLNSGKMAALALASSPNLASNNLAAFHAQAKSLLSDEFPGFTFVLHDQTERQLVNTIIPYGQTLPGHGDTAQVRQVFETGKPVVSDVFIAGVLRGPKVAISVPVWRDGKVVYALSVGFLPQRLGKILTEQRLPADRIVAIFDTKGVIVARTHDPNKFVGQKGAALLVDRMRETTEGEVDVTSVEGIPIYCIFSRSPVSGWTVAIGVPKSTVLAELLQSVAWISGVVIALLITGFGLAWYLGGAISRSVKALALPAETLGGSEQRMLPMSFREADEVAAELLRHRHHLEHLVDERTRQLEKSKALLETLYATAPVGLSFIGPDLRFVAVNEYLAAINGKSVEDHVGRTLREVIGALGDSVERTYRRVLESGQPLLNMEVSGTLPASPQRLGHWLVSYYPVFGPEHEILGVNGVVLDISERKQHEATQDETKRQLESQLAEISKLQLRLQEQVIRDPLTGLHNRRFLDETLPRELARAKREGYALALIMIDLDKFKRVNDTYGHAAGDQVLKALAAILGKNARESDVICRYGGEEFLVALPRISLELAMQRANEWRLELARTPVRHGELVINVTLSAGVAAFPEHGIDIDTLLSRADQALYRSKDEGRDRVTCFSAAATATL